MSIVHTKENKLKIKYSVPQVELKRGGSEPIHPLKFTPLTKVANPPRFGPLFRTAVPSFSRSFLFRLSYPIHLIIKQKQIIMTLTDIKCQ